MTEYYVPGTEEKDPKKVIMSLQQAHEKTATNTTDIATNTANIATNAADIATNTADIAANTAAIATKLGAASQADQEAASSTTVGVTPGRQHFHPSAAKAWAYFDGKTGSTVTTKATHGISNIARNSTGNYTITFTTAFSSATAYTFVGNAVNVGVGASIIYVGATSDITTATFTFGTFPSIGGAAADCDIITIAFYGDQ